MRPRAIFLIVVVLAIFGALAWYVNATRTSGKEVPNSALANPASVNCTQTRGGTLEIKDEASGQNGYCRLPDGRVCEEWALFQGNDCFAPSAATTTPGIPYVAGNLLLGTNATTTLGAYLIGSNGRALYTYEKDTNGVSNCAGACAENWPPYTLADTSALSSVQAGITGIAGAMTRADGSVQVTYDGKPLYFHTDDKNGSDTTGEGTDGAWRVARP